MPDLKRNIVKLRDIQLLLSHKFQNLERHTQTCPARSGNSKLCCSSAVYQILNPGFKVSIHLPSQMVRFRLQNKAGKFLKGSSDGKSPVECHILALPETETGEMNSTEQYTSSSDCSGYKLEI